MLPYRPLPSTSPLLRSAVAAFFLTAFCVHAQEKELLPPAACPNGTLAKCEFADAPLPSKYHFRIKRRSYVNPTTAILIGAAAATAISLRYDMQISNALRVSDAHSALLQKAASYAAEYAPVIFSAGSLTSGIVRHKSNDIDAGAQVTGALFTDLIAERSIKATLLRGDLGTAHPGQFFSAPNVHSSSFPSGHAMAAFSFARVIQERYPGKHLALPMYGLATVVGVSRVMSGNHFASDVIVGSTLGYFIGGALSHHGGRRRNIAVTVLPSRGGVQMGLEVHLGQR